MVLEIAGGQVLVDKTDLLLLGSYKWHVSDTGYAVWRGIKDGVKQTVRMHRLLMDAPKDMVIDHLNGNPLDNRKANLRICTQSDNQRNRKGDKGYVWDKSKQKWLVRYRGTFYGRYNTEVEAIKAYKMACSGVPYKKRERRQMYHLPAGVFRNKTNKGYQARPQINGKRIYLGTFATIEEAHKAYLDRKRG